MPEPGELIASGRAADVYAYGDGLVLRRYRTPHDTEYEAAVMRYVREHGYPVPEVIEASGRDMVMQRIEGISMLEDLPKRPWRLGRHARTLADLHRRLHEIEPPSWLVPKLGGGSAIVHLDLHPLNVMVTRDGPVVIDWSNAGLGAPEADAADLWLLMANAEAPGSRVERALIKAGRGAFLRAFLKEIDVEATRAYLRVAYEHRSRDRNMSESERERMQRFVERRAL